MNNKKKNKKSKTNQLKMKDTGEQKKTSAELSFFYMYLLPTLNNNTPITANMNCSRHVTRTILPIVLTATITHCTTCYIIFMRKKKEEENNRNTNIIKRDTFKKKKNKTKLYK